MSKLDYIKGSGFREVMLQRLRHELRRRCVGHLLEGLELDFKVWVDEFVNQVVFSIRASIFAEYGPERKIEYPATWVDALKARWMPEWVVKRWPKLGANYKRYVLQAQVLYPDLKVSLPHEGHSVIVAVREELPPMCEYD